MFWRQPISKRVHRLDESKRFLNFMRKTWFEWHGRTDTIVSAKLQHRWVLSSYVRYLLRLQYKKIIKPLNFRISSRFSRIRRPWKSLREFRPSKRTGFFKVMRATRILKVKTFFKLHKDQQQYKKLKKQKSKQGINFHFRLNLSFIGERFFVVVDDFSKQCLLTLSSGMFIADRPTKVRDKPKHRENLELWRGLKHKVKKKLSKKRQILHWKCQKKTKFVKLLTLRCAVNALAAAKFAPVLVQISGVPRYWTYLLQRMFRFFNQRDLLLKTIVFKQLAYSTSSKRAIAKKLYKKMTEAEESSDSEDFSDNDDSR